MASRSTIFARRAAKAAANAIAIYNQPFGVYREETFSILVVNAWELLLKAKILKENKNKLKAIYEKKRKVGGRKIVPHSRSGSRKTISIGTCIEKARQYSDGVDPNVRENIELLLEVRDNSTHFINDEPALSDIVLQLGIASLLNFYKLYQRWFGPNPEFGFAPLPLAFRVQPLEALQTPKNLDVRRLVEFIDKRIKREEKSDFPVAVQMNLTFAKDLNGGGQAIRLTNNPSAPEYRMTDDEFRKRFPHDYDALLNRLKSRISGIVINKKFHALLRKVREQNPTLWHTRYLNPLSQKMEIKFYSEAFISKIIAQKARLDIRAT